VVDVGHHDAYSRTLGILPACARRLQGLPVLFVGVRCPLDEILRRRAASESEAGRRYAQAEGGEIPVPILRWQEAVHVPGHYDLEVDTSQATPEACAEQILSAVSREPQAPRVFELLALDAPPAW
jgi:chloramphenicol 3-O phosphotransferase